MAAGQKVRVIIVDDIAETRENVRKLLQFESDIEVIGAAKSGKEGIEFAKEQDPDVVLMDINMPDMDGISATEAILRSQPHVQVIILSVQGDQNYMRRAMLAGARDFLTKPPMADELISAIRRAGEMAQHDRTKNAQARSVPSLSGAPAGGAFSITQGKVVTVYSPKGGTGCTTIAVNLALTLHNEDTRTTLVDGNFQFGDVAVFINEQGKNTIIDLATRVNELDPEIVEGVMIKHIPTGVHVLAAPSRPEYAEKVSGDQFAQLIDYLRQLYAYVVIDTTPALDLLQTIGIGRERIVFCMNRYDKRIAITPERVGDNLKQPVAAVIPLDERVVVPAVNRGVPFVLDNKAQPAARGILSLAGSVREALAAAELSESEAVK